MTYNYFLRSTNNVSHIGSWKKHRTHPNVSFTWLQSFLTALVAPFSNWDSRSLWFNLLSIFSDPCPCHHFSLQISHKFGKTPYADLSKGVLANPSIQNEWISLLMTKIVCCNLQACDSRRVSAARGTCVDVCAHEWRLGEMPGRVCECYMEWKHPWLCLRCLSGRGSGATHGSSRPPLLLEAWHPGGSLLTPQYMHNPCSIYLKWRRIIGKL